MDRLTNNTLYVVVNCSMEESRYTVMQKVIKSIKDEQRRCSADIESDMIAFDNGSTHPGSVDMLKQLDCDRFASNDNMGYWSALSWILKELPNIRSDHERFKYVYVIESDHFHFGLNKIAKCEQALDWFPWLGGVRTQEYIVQEQHLYNKTKQLPNGRKYAWVSHVNAVTGENVEFTLLDAELNVYKSNFLTCLHAVNRLHALRDVFAELQNMKKFSELDFQRLYYYRYPLIGQVDGGVFHAKLGFTPQNPASLSGSWSNNVSEHGYMQTRNDAIRKYAYGSIRKV